MTLIIAKVATILKTKINTIMMIMLIIIRMTIKTKTMAFTIDVTKTKIKMISPLIMKI